jgi:AcrR family transcriptional regulator
MRKIAQRDDIRDLLLDGVDALLARFGFRKMTMEDLAREVGIGKGTIYLHFPSKEELALAHVDRIAERLLLRLRRIAAGPGSAPERLRRMLLARVLDRFDSVTHYSQNLDDLLSSVRTPLLARRQAHFEKEAAVLAEVLRDGRAQGVFDCPGIQASAHTLVWCTNSLLPFSLSARELGERDELEKRVTVIVDLLLKGLLRRPPRPSKRRR